MRTVSLEEIRSAVDFLEVIAAMREAVIAQSRGDCDTPMPMHLSIGGEDSEVHIKSSYRRGGDFWALKAAGSFPKRAARGEPSGTGMMLLFSAETGEPVAFFQDGGWMTDVRTAAVAAMAARELSRRDRTIGILGTGVQARLQAVLHAEVLPLERVVAWGRAPARVEELRRDLSRLLPRVQVVPAPSPAEVARQALLVVTATAARGPLLTAGEIRPGTLLSAVGTDSPGKQELDPAILGKASLLLVDSLSQCERLGELQHAPAEKGMAVELGAFCQSPLPVAPQDIIVCDFTGLGVEDLAIAEYVYRKLGRDSVPV
ncbi:MAG: ornithine cyclodeaminase family protein [Thermoanaerobaculia bacterium]